MYIVRARARARSGFEEPPIGPVRLQRLSHTFGAASLLACNICGSDGGGVEDAGGVSSCRQTCIFASPFAGLDPNRGEGDEGGVLRGWCHTCHHTGDAVFMLLRDHLSRRARLQPVLFVGLNRLAKQNALPERRPKSRNPQNAPCTPQGRQVSPARQFRAAERHGKANSRDLCRHP